MNLEELNLNGTNNITITNSLNAPLLKLSVENKGNAPEGNDLIISVGTTSADENPRNYVFTLSSPLGLNDTFKVEPSIKGSKITMVAKVLRANGMEEEVAYESIMLNEGDNYITTNYSNVTINLTYPKNIELISLFLNNAIYSQNKENKILSLDDIYFKDCFTEVEDKINASFNRLTVKCFNSENGNFSMDCDGNLIVNSITARNGSIGGINIDDVYPVGSIYLSVNNVNPSTLFGGSWEAYATGRTLVGVDPNQVEFNTVNKTGGNKYLQSHTHGAYTNAAGNHYHTGNTLEVQSNLHQTTTNDCARNIYSSYNHAGVTITNYAGEHSHSVTVNYTGSGNGENLQPYITCYMWRRTA